MIFPIDEAPIEEATIEKAEPSQGNSDTNRKRKSKKERIYEKWEFLCSCSSIFGLTRVHYQNNQFLTATWVLTSLGCLAFGLYLTRNSIMDYLSFNVITNIKSVLEIPIVFPSVTLCSPNLTTSLLDTSQSSFGWEIDTFDRLNVTLEEFDSVYGSCIRFNGFINESVPLRTVNSTSLNTDSLGFFIPILPNKSAEIVMYVSPNTLNGFSNISEKYLYAGKYYNFYIRKTVDEKLGEPYNSCQSQTYGYHPENCIEECINKQVAEQYQCRLTGYYQDNRLEKCLDRTDMKNKYTEEAMLRREFIPYCKSQCVEACFSEQYFLWCLEYKPPTDDSFYVSFNFAHTEYTYTYQIPKMSATDLISNVGGTLGMVVGFQFLSLVEIFDFLFEVALILSEDLINRD